MEIKSLMPEEPLNVLIRRKVKRQDKNGMTTVRYPSSHNGRRMDGWMDGWMDGRTDGRMDAQGEFPLMDAQ